MDRFDFIVIGKLSGAFGISVISFLYGGFTKALIALLVCSIADFITGWIAGAIEGKLKSKLSFIGIGRKVLIFSIVAVAHVIDGIVGDGKGHLVRDTVIYFYIANEILSITENLSRAGVPFPTIITQMVEVLQSKNNRGKGVGK
jgi:toxin secretion/phage lysis holin